MKTYSKEEYQTGEGYRVSWYATRKLHMAFSWGIISQEAKDKWTKEALEEGYGEGSS